MHLLTPYIGRFLYFIVRDCVLSILHVTRLVLFIRIVNVGFHLRTNQIIVKTNLVILIMYFVISASGTSASITITNDNRLVIEKTQKLKLSRVVNNEFILNIVSRL